MPVKNIWRRSCTQFAGAAVGEGCMCECMCAAWRYIPQGGLRSGRPARGARARMGLINRNQRKKKALAETKGQFSKVADENRVLLKQLEDTQRENYQVCGTLGRCVHSTARTHAATRMALIAVKDEADSRYKMSWFDVGGNPALVQRLPRHPRLACRVHACMHACIRVRWSTSTAACGQGRCTSLRSPMTQACLHPTSCQAHANQ